MRERLAFVDAMRGLAALGVVLYHAKEGNHVPALELKLPWLGGLLELGHFGVPVFFVLSGFVIALSLDGAQMRLSGVGWFMLRRSIRLDPPYWVAIAVQLGITLIKDGNMNHFSSGQIAAHFFYLQELIGYNQISIVFWTLCFEFQFYLVYSLLLCAPRQDLMLISAIAISLLWPLHIIPVIMPGLFLHLWHGFLLGVCAYWTLNKGFPLSLFLSFAMVVSVFGGSFSLACALAASLIVIVGLGKQLGSLNWRWIQGLGAISYSLYLIHNPVTYVTYIISEQVSEHSIMTDALWWTVSTALCLLAAWAMRNAIEKPAMAFARRVKPNLLSTQNKLTPAQERPA